MGIDGGDVFKEFFTDLSKEVFDTERGLWLVRMSYIPTMARMRQNVSV